MSFKKLKLPELEPKLLEPKLLEPKIERAELVRITPQTEEQQPIIVAKLSDGGDPPSGWRKILLDEDPISVTDITKVGEPWSATATASGNTTVKDPALAEKKVRVKLIDVWNSGTADITVFLRFTAAGTARFKKLLAAKTGFIVNLVGSNWEGGAAEILFINLSAAGTVEFTVMGEVV